VPIRLYDSAGAEPEREPEAGPNIVSGIVVNNCEGFPQGLILVRIPSLDQEVWARLTSIGAGANAGFLYTPRVGDEVVVAMSTGGLDNAYVLGGLWSTRDSPPLAEPRNAFDAQTKRVIRTGLTPQWGHVIEFDDARQSITIVSSTEQKITIDPTTIELTNAAGSLTIALDNESQTIRIEGVNVSVEAAAKLTLKGRRVEIRSEPLPLSITSTSACSIKGTPINLN
jgi:uncharacterized protein involved in type VI secretion and phage assembly